MSTYASMTAPETCAMPPTIIVKSSEVVVVDDAPRDENRGFRLPDEHVRRDAQRLGAGDLHRLLHDPRHALDDDLDDPEVVQDREERADEDDDWEDLEREDDPPEAETLFLPRASIGPASQPNRNDDPWSAYPIACETPFENDSRPRLPGSQ